MNWKKVLVIIVFASMGSFGVNLCLDGKWLARMLATIAIAVVYGFVMTIVSRME